MKWLRESLSTLVRLLKSGPFGNGRVKFDDHSYRAIGKDGEK